MAGLRGGARNRGKFSFPAGLLPNRKSSRAWGKRCCLWYSPSPSPYLHKLRLCGISVADKTFLFPLLPQRRAPFTGPTLIVALIGICVVELAWLIRFSGDAYGDCPFFNLYFTRRSTYVDSVGKSPDISSYLGVITHQLIMFDHFQYTDF